MAALVRDDVVRRAAAGISLRSEQELDPNRPNIFVDPGVVDRLDNVNHQILFGRRGTGKTHLFQRVRSLLAEDGHAAVFIDARTLGSSHQYMNRDEPMALRCAALFRDFLGELHYRLLEYVVELDVGDPERALEELDHMADSILAPTHTERGGSYGASRTREQVRSSSAGIEASATPSIDLRSARNDTGRRSEEMTVEFSTDNRLVFPAVSQHLINVLKYIPDAKLYVLIDEWSALPADIQPLMAEFVKRCLLPVPGLTVKIAAVKYRSKFQGELKRRPVGLELGADISTAVNLDDHYIWEGNEQLLEKAYAEILYQHLRYQIPRLRGSTSRNAQLSSNYFKAHYKIGSSSSLVRTLFDDGAFSEVCEASSGVVRDFLALVSNAIRDLHLQSKWHARELQKLAGGVEPDEVQDPDEEAEADLLSVDRIRRVSKEWFEQDKIDHVDHDLRRRLNELERVCLLNLKSRYFLVPSEIEIDADLAKLLDARLLHRVISRYSHPSRPGERYEVYSLDYGSYVSVYADQRGPADKRRTGKHIDGILGAFRDVKDPLRLRYVGGRGLEAGGRA